MAEEALIIQFQNRRFFTFDTYQKHVQRPFFIDLNFFHFISRLPWCLLGLPAWPCETGSVSDQMNLASWVFSRPISISTLFIHLTLWNVFQRFPIRHLTCEVRKMSPMSNWRGTDCISKWFQRNGQCSMDTLLGHQFSWQSDESFWSRRTDRVLTTSIIRSTSKESEPRWSSRLCIRRP
jgi:hypothetical protein